MEARLDRDNVEKLLAAREATEEYEASFSRDARSAVSEFHERLGELGFRTSQEFFKWNHKMNLLHLMDCLEVRGSCNRCAGHPRTPPCYERFGERSCYSTRETYSKAYFMEMCLSFLYNKQWHVGSSPRETMTFCPNGYRFIVKRTGWLFDVSWNR